jgi:hypothetical protein
MTLPTHAIIILVFIAGAALSAGVVLFSALEHRLRSKSLYGRLFDLIPSQEPSSPEQFFLALHGLQRARHRFFAPRPHVSLEVYGRAGTARYGVWIPEGHEGFVCSLLRATYPGIEIRPAQVDPLSDLPPGVAAVSGVSLYESRYLPVRASTEKDPLATLLATMARAGQSELVHLSLVLRPKPNGWQVVARRVGERMREGHVSFLYELLFGRSKSQRPSHYRVQQAKAIDDKASRLGFDAVIRLVAVAPTEGESKEYLRSIAGALRVFDAENSFAFRRIWRRSQFLQAARERRFVAADATILNTTELAGIYHMPAQESPYVDGVRSPKLAPPADAPREGCILGESNYPGQDGRLIALTDFDARRGVHIQGPPGVGKTVLLTHLAMQWIRAGHGVCILDAKGDLADAVSALYPRERLNKVIYISATTDSSVGVNPLEWHDPLERYLLVENVISILKNSFPASSWGSRTEDTIRSGLLAITRRPDAVISQLPALLLDPAYRAREIADLDPTDPLMTWFRWFDSQSDGARAEIVGPSLAKLRSYMTRPRLARMLNQRHSNIDFRSFIDNGGVLIANLSSGLWGEEPARLVGGFLIHKLWSAARSRAGVPEEQRPDYHLLMDEFQQFVAGAGPIEDALAMARSFRLDMVMANQHYGQLPRSTRDAIASNARSKIVYQVGRDDAAILAHEFAPLDADALMNQPRYEAAVRLSVHGETSRPFTIRVLPPEEVSDPGAAQAVIEATAARFPRSSEDIDQEIRQAIWPEQPSIPIHGVGRRPREEA